MRKRKASPDLFSLKCEECGCYLERSVSGLYLVCPKGHGKLQLDADRPELFEEHVASMFDANA